MKPSPCGGFCYGVTMSLRKVLAAACLGASLCGGANAALVDWSGRASTAVGTDLREEQVAFERGVEALLRQDYALAERQFNKSREINPKWVEPYLGLADVELARKHGDKARALLTRALELKPDSAVAWSGMGRLEFNEGRYTEAGARSRRRLNSTLQLARPDRSRRPVSHPSGQARAGGRAYRSAIRLQQRHGGARYGLGASLMALGDYRRQAMRCRGGKAQPGKYAGQDRSCTSQARCRRAAGGCRHIR